MNPFDMMKNLGSLKEQAEKMQAELAQVEVTGSSGGNMVRVTMNGKFEVLGVELDPICVDNRDVPMLQDLIVAACHDAQSKVQDELKNRLGPLAQGMGIPGL